MRFLILYDVDGWSMHRQAAGVARWHGTGHHVEAMSMAQLSARAIKVTEHIYDSAFLAWMDSWDAVLHMSWYGSWGFREGVNEAGYPRPKFKRNVALVTSDGFLYEETRNPFKLVEDWRLLVQTRNRNAGKARDLLPIYDCLLAANKRYETALGEQGFKTFYAPGGVDHEQFKPTRPISTDGPLRVGWCGHVNDDDYPNVKGYELLLLPLMDRYNGIDVLLVTSICEGTPCPAQEAMTCGRPVIGTSVGILPELVTQTFSGNLVDIYLDDETRGIAMRRLYLCISDLIADRRLVSQMGEHARAEIEANWTWQKRAGDYIEALEWAAKQKQCLTRPNPFANNHFD